MAKKTMKLIITFFISVISFSISANVYFMPDKEKEHFENKVKGFITGYSDNIFEIKFAKINDEFFLYEIHDAHIVSGIHLGSLQTQKSAKILGGFPKTIGYDHSGNEIKIISKHSSMHRGIATESIYISTCNKQSFICDNQEAIRANWDADTGNCGRDLKNATEIVSIELEKSEIKVVTKEFDCSNSSTQISNLSFAM